MWFLWLIIGFAIGGGAGAGTMYFAQRKGLVAKVENRVSEIWFEKNAQLVRIQEDIKGLKDVKAGDMDDALKDIRDKIEDLF